MKGFIYTMLILSAIVFLYRSHIGFPDLATSLGQLNAAYEAQVLHTPFGDFTATGEAQRYQAASNPYAQGNAAQNYYAPTTTQRSYSGN